MWEVQGQGLLVAYPRQRPGRRGLAGAGPSDTRAWASKAAGRRHRLGAGRHCGQSQRGSSSEQPSGTGLSYDSAGDSGSQATAQPAAGTGGPPEAMAYSGCHHDTSGTLVQYDIMYDYCSQFLISRTLMFTVSDITSHIWYHYYDIKVPWHDHDSFYDIIVSIIPHTLW
jgi:hypothetical protein